MRLFTTARLRKQLRCPSADEWIRKLWCLYTVDYYSAIKRNTFESVLMRWMKLEPIIQNEVSEKERGMLDFKACSLFSLFHTTPKAGNLSSFIFVFPTAYGAFPNTQRVQTVIKYLTKISKKKKKEIQKSNVALP